MTVLDRLAEYVAELKAGHINRFMALLRELLECGRSAKNTTVDDVL
jgi:hypothetical protein